MPDHRRALRAARPVAAGPVLPRRGGPALGLGAGQRGMLVGGITAPVYHVALLGQRGLLCQIVAAVQLIDVLGDNDAFAVLPGAIPDAIARIDRCLPVCRLSAEIGVPGTGPRARRLRQLLA